MLGLERLAVIVESHPRPAVVDIVDRQVRGIAAVAERQHITGIMGYLIQQRAHGYTPPYRVELGPARHAVNVYRDGFIGQRLEFRPSPRLERVAALPNRECPLRYGRMRRRPSRQHWEVLGQVLPWRDPGLLDRGRPTFVAKTTRNGAAHDRSAPSRLGPG